MRNCGVLQPPVGWDRDGLQNLNTLKRQFDYTSRGGPPTGPTQRAQSRTMREVIQTVFDWGYLGKMAKWTNEYGTMHWLKPKSPGSKKLVYCSAKDPETRHRWAAGKGKKRWFDATAGSMMVFLGVLIAMSAMRTRHHGQVWATTHSTRVPWVANAMPLDAFRQHLRYVAFGDYRNRPDTKDPMHDRLWRVRSLLIYFKKVFQQMWTLGKHIAVDESMIKYSGRAISFVQYMPAKPIKHGIKVFCLCCGETGYLHSFDIYTGKDGTDAATGRVSVLQRLFYGAGLETCLGRVLYTDNWYTCMEVACWVFVAHGMYMVGTMRLTSKQSRTAADFPWSKLKPSVTAKLPRGWLRRTTQKLTVNGAVHGARKLWAQAMIWKDKKLVGLLDTFGVGPGNTVVKRWNKHKRVSEDIPTHPSYASYSKHMGGVDAMDRDLRDWGMSVRTSRWYMRVAFWVLDVAVANLWRIAIYAAKNGDEDSEFSVYRKRSKGRYGFRMDLARTMIEMGLERDQSEKVKRGSGRGRTLTPCDCKRCFHCKRGLTTGIAHKPTARKATRLPKLRCGQPSQWVAQRRKGICSGCISRLKAHKEAHLEDCMGEEWTPAGIIKRRNPARVQCKACKRRFCLTCMNSHGRVSTS